MSSVEIVLKRPASRQGLLIIQNPVINADSLKSFPNTHGTISKSYRIKKREKKYSSRSLL